MAWSAILVPRVHEAVRDWWMDVLGAAGYGVVAMADGREALGRVARIRPDLILLDLVMPGIDGPSGADREGAAALTLKTLLVADDEPNNVELIRMVLEEIDLPIQLVIAQNGLEAVDRAREFAPALILMDLKMPGFDGWEATRRLKADPATAEIPVVALTAQALTGDRERALAAGCDGYLTKPINVHDVVRLLRHRLG